MSQDAWHAIVWHFFLWKKKETPYDFFGFTDIRTTVKLWCEKSAFISGTWPSPFTLYRHFRTLKLHMVPLGQPHNVPILEPLRSAHTSPASHWHTRTHTHQFLIKVYKKCLLNLSSHKESTRSDQWKRASSFLWWFENKVDHHKLSFLIQSIL